MLIFLRHIKSVVRKSLITNKKDLMMENSFEIFVRFGKSDNKKRILKILDSAMNTNLKTKNSIQIEGENIFLRNCNTNFYKLNWWEYNKTGTLTGKMDSIDLLFVKAAIAKYGLLYEEVEAISKENNYPLPTLTDIKNDELFLAFYYELYEALKKARDNESNGVLMEDPTFCQVYEYDVLYQSDEVICLKS